MNALAANSYLAERGISDPLRLLAHGSPITRTLEACAAMAAGIYPRSRCGVLLVDNERFNVSAAHGLNGSDQRLLTDLCQLPLNRCLQYLEELATCELRLLMTSAAELIGALVLFGVRPLEERMHDQVAISQLYEVCALATIAVENEHLVDELYFRAHHDALTQLWNRVWLEEEMARVLDDAQNTGAFTGLLLIGIDSFRVINDLLGSQAGNDLLRAVGLRLAGSLRLGWSLARFGGDEFAVLIPDLNSASEMDECANSLLGSFEEVFEIHGHDLQLRATIGSSVSGPGECLGDELQNRADVALRFGKNGSRSRVLAFTAAMISTPPERLEMERHLRLALKKKEFELFYQPQVELSTGKLLGVEALLRWKHPSLGFISPATFIPIAEQIGIIEEIGEWVMLQAIRQLERWHRMGLPNLRMAVNVSAVQFSGGTFVDFVAKCLQDATIQPCDLELEITESAVMRDLEYGARQINHLRSLGVLTALDDFGTGHSSLAYLQRLPIQRIKIDRMFVKDMTSKTNSHPLLSSIIQMSRALGCAVIAEGVETAEQAVALSMMDCDEVQGFFFSRPLPAAELLSWATVRTATQQAEEDMELLERV